MCLGYALDGGLLHAGHAEGDGVEGVVFVLAEGFPVHDAVGGDGGDFPPFTFFSFVADVGPAGAGEASVDEVFGHVVDVIAPLFAVVVAGVAAGDASFPESEDCLLVVDGYFVSADVVVAKFGVVVVDARDVLVGGVDGGGRDFGDGEAVDGDVALQVVGPFVVGFGAGHVCSAPKFATPMKKKFSV